MSEREEISRGVSAGPSIRAIARQLNRAPSTISREIARNGGTGHSIELWKQMSEPCRLLCGPNAASWSKTGTCAMRSNVSCAANGLQSK
ncbi:helix-turn-helix domain-containing protein [Burkholderia diffusa]|uniref:helix-turn-helix domain-containing protein n=1 Tax=Burkholderia diffusa TaxID=488732 RepID=UPI003AF70214